jgi:hypothetical protein
MKSRTLFIGPEACTLLKILKALPKRVNVRTLNALPISIVLRIDRVDPNWTWLKILVPEPTRM